MGSFQKLLELPTRNLNQANNKQGGFYMMEMWMLCGWKIWTVSWMITNFLLLSMVIVLDYRNSVRCFLKLLIFNMLPQPQSVDVVWSMSILEILVINLIGINGCWSSLNIDKNMLNLLPIWMISIQDIFQIWWPESLMVLTVMKHWNLSNLFFQEPTWMWSYN